MREWNAVSMHATAGILGRIALHRADAGQRRRQVQGRKVADADQVCDQLVVDACRSRVPRASVHDAVPDRFDTVHGADGRRECGIIESPFRHLELVLGEDLVAVVDQAHLQRAGTGVDDEYAQA